MNDVNISLKARLSEVLETVSIIVLVYAIFLIILGIYLHNSELILQTCIMFVVYVIFEYVNYDLVTITNSGIRCDKYGFLSWDNMYIMKRKNRNIYIYTKTRKKPYKFVMKKAEDNVEIERACKYINSMLRPEHVHK